MQVKPVEDRFGLRPFRGMIACEIAEPTVIAEDDAAMAPAVPQAALGFDVDVPVCALFQHVAYVGEQRLSTSATVATSGGFGRITAGGT